ncbi:MAG: oligopeptide/dipeptide transporter, ATPase subunit [Proteobacteria bacterium]|nr:oligopeptide/dipeptide transporter, ATPase subunit [Pseudomonadota bacterium]
MTKATSGKTHRADELVTVSGVSAHFAVRSGLLRRRTGTVKAVDGVDLVIRRGETLGLVGESGCGKTTLARTILGLRPADEGEVVFDGHVISQLPPRDLKPLRRHMQLIFQDPYASLDPHATIGRSIRAGLDIHGIGRAAERSAIVADMMNRVGLDPALADRFPHEFSGGQRQRVGIARALVLNPQLVVCDEPVSALDVSIQSQILNLIKDLQADLGLTYLFVSHNLAVVEHVADRVAVMYLGRIVEIADREALFGAPRHPYTQALLAAVPQPDPTHRRTEAPLAGETPSPDVDYQGCRFRGRCPVAIDRCRTQEPELAGPVNGHRTACWRVADGL